MRETILQQEKEIISLKTRLEVMQSRLGEVEGLSKLIPELEERLVWLENKIKKKERTIFT